MSNEIVMELMERIIRLEKVVESLDEKVLKLESNNSPDNVEATKNDMKKTTARAITMERLKEYNQELIFTKANRDKGSGILCIDKEDEHQIRFMYSKNYSEDSDHIRAWHIVTKETVDNELVTHYVFTVYKEVMHTFILTAAELREMVKQKMIDKNNKYHFYITIRENGKFDERESDNIIDFQQYYNKWNITFG